jgi:hypothetical protein
MSATATAGSTWVELNYSVCVPRLAHKAVCTGKAPIALAKLAPVDNASKQDKQGRPSWRCFPSTDFRYNGQVDAWTSLHLDPEDRFFRCAGDSVYTRQTLPEISATIISKARISIQLSPCRHWKHMVGTSWWLRVDSTLPNKSQPQLLLTVSYATDRRQ